MRVLLLTHVFPRAADDPLGAFLLHLIHGFGARARFQVLAPHAAGLAEHESIGGIPVTRFRYASDADETLAYTGVMHERVAQSAGGKLLFARFLLAYLRAARRAARADSPTVLHAHWWLPGGLVGALVSQFTRIPLVITTHGTDVEQLRRAPRTKTLARFVFRRARIITCGSQYLRQQLLELGVADPARVRVIPMPVNPLFTAPPLAPRAAMSCAPFHILTVARLTRQKNVATLIDALALLRGRGMDARLQIAGDGDQRAALESKTRAAQLEPFVTFLGMRPQSELPELYAASDVFVLASEREGMGLVLAEALLCGAPVIAASSGGVTDIVIEGETGLVFGAQDANALADAVEKYARDPQLAARLAERGRARVLEHFAPARVAAQFLEAYESAR
jgi:glycosyltransferase involved in cell wall biosynthesis